MPAADPPFEPDPKSGPPPDPASHPAVVVGVVVGLQAVALVGFGLWELWRGTVDVPGNPAVARGTTAYFLVLGALVAGVAVAVLRAARWSHGAALFLQLLALPVAATMATAGFWVGALPLGGLALLALAVLVSPRGRAAFGR